MAAGVASLRDDHVRPRRSGLLGLLERLHLTDDPGSRRLDAGGVWRGIAKRQHDGHRLCIECHLEGRRVLVERPEDETDADTGVAGLGQLLPYHRRAGIARTQQAETAG